MRVSDFAAWNDALAQLIRGPGDQNCEQLVQALRVGLDFDQSFLALFRRDGAPVVLFHSGAPVLDRDYADGPYLLDPFYVYFLADSAGGCFHLSEIAPEGFARSDYFLNYYRHIGISDEIGLIHWLDRDRAAHISIGRGIGRKRFTQRDCEWLKATAPLGAAIVERAAADSIRPEPQVDAMHESLQCAYRQFGSSVLTDRETQVVRMLLRGSSAKAIARGLEISPDTARNHLKRIYPKLGVASQAELFALFFRALEHAKPGGEEDPLLRLRA